MGGCLGGICGGEKGHLMQRGRSQALPQSKSRPIVVTVSAAGGQVGHSLVPMIANGDMFGHTQRVVIKLLDLNLEGPKSNMAAMKMELEDGNFPLLTACEVSTEDSVGLKDADYAILLGAWPQVGKKEEIAQKNFTIFRSIGHAIHNTHNKNIRVLLVGNPACTNCQICAKYSRLPFDQFFALSRLDCNRATGMVATRAKCSVADVSNVMVWGSHSETAVVDVEHAKIRVDGATRGAVEFLSNQKNGEGWVENTLTGAVANRGQEIMAKKKASSSVAASRAIVDHIHDLFCGTPDDAFVSMGVYNDSGAYGITRNIWFSLPVKCQAHDVDQPSRAQYTIVTGLQLGKETREKIRAAEQELVDDKEHMDKLITQSNEAKGLALGQKAAV